MELLYLFLVLLFKVIQYLTKQFYKFDLGTDWSKFPSAYAETTQSWQIEGVAVNGQISNGSFFTLTPANKQIKIELQDHSLIPMVKLFTSGVCSIDIDFHFFKLKKF